MSEHDVRQISDDTRWFIDQERNGWTLPFRAWWPLRLPIIRNIRAVWHAIQIERHYERLTMIGLGRTGYDEWVVYAVARGWA